MMQLLCLYFNPCGLNADLLPDEDGLDDIYISEMLSSKPDGTNFSSLMK
jgi:hypothetical protein